MASLLTCLPVEDALDQKDVDELFLDEPECGGYDPVDEPVELVVVPTASRKTRVSTPREDGHRTWWDISDALVRMGEPRLCGQTIRNTHDRALQKIREALSDVEKDDLLSALRSLAKRRYRRERKSA